MQARPALPCPASERGWAPVLPHVHVLQLLQLQWFPQRWRLGGRPSCSCVLLVLLVSLARPVALAGNLDGVQEAVGGCLDQGRRVAKACQTQHQAPSAHAHAHAQHHQQGALRRDSAHTAPQGSTGLGWAGLTCGPLCDVVQLGEHAVGVTLRADAAIRRAPGGGGGMNAPAQERGRKALLQPCRRLGGRKGA